MASTKSGAAAAKDSGVVSDEQLNDSAVQSAHGLRFVRPYEHAYAANCKRRWVGQRVLDVLSNEFVGLSRADFEAAIAQQRVLLNGLPITADRVFRESDSMLHRTHRHEPPVVADALQLLPDSLAQSVVVAVNKPGSIPVHPGGRYRHNSLTFLLARELGLRPLFIAHRLDRLTSGVVLFGRSTEAAAALAQLILTHQTRKCYLARVQGNMHAVHAAAFLRVDQPIVVRGSYEGVCGIGSDGKRAVTFLRSLYYDAASDESVVLCVPVTGRTHQIRVHLQHAGFPIANDPLYASVSQDQQQQRQQGPTMSDGRSKRRHQQVMHDAAQPRAAAAAESSAPSQPVVPLSPFASEQLDWCTECVSPEPDPTPESLLIFLHAYSYTLCRPAGGWPAALPYADERVCFQTSLPAWASGTSDEAIAALVREFDALPESERRIADETDNNNNTD